MIELEVFLDSYIRNKGKYKKIMADLGISDTTYYKLRRLYKDSLASTGYLSRANTVVNYTFWTKQRLAKGVTVKTVAQELGLTQGAMQTYFSGEHVPRDYALMKICKYFDVDIETGRAEFAKDHKLWNDRHSDAWRAHDKQRESEYHKKYNQTRALPYCISFDRINDADLIAKLDNIELGARSTYVKWVLRGHLGNDFFSTERLTPEVVDILKVIHPLIPFDEFMQVLSRLIDSKTLDMRPFYGTVDFDTYLQLYLLKNRI